jgi:predicted O-methyltransferase YrrM
MRLKHRLVDAAARAAAAVPSSPYRRLVVDAIWRRAPQDLLQVVQTKFNRAPTVDAMPLDLGISQDTVAFEELAGLFTSNDLNRGVIGMTFREAAYIFGLVRRLGAERAIEIGRWRGGSTILLAAALGPKGTLWSIDNEEKEERLAAETLHERSYDDQTREFLARHGLRAELLVGDSRTIDVATGEVDVVLIDGDHSYDGVRSDFERFGTRVRVGGAVLLDDAFPSPPWTSHEADVGRLVDEVVAAGDFRLAARIDHVAHLERVR